MDTQRLHTLADFLDTVPEEKFYMGLWAESAEFANKCGATACAFGWACEVLEFKKAGLSMSVSIYNGGRSPTHCYHPTYLGRQGFVAAEVFFDLEADEAEYLFAEEWGDEDRASDTPKDAAQRIRDFIKHGVPDA